MGMFTTLIFSNVFLTLVNRSFYDSVFTTLCYKNKLMPVVLTAALLVLFLSLYFAPIRNLFQFTSPTTFQLITCLSAAFIGVFWVEGWKFYKRK